MQQEINLYPLLPLKRKSFITLKMMMVSYGIFVFILALNFCFDLWKQHKQINSIAELSVKIEKSHKRLADIQAKYPMIDLNDIENSVKKIQQELDEKNSVFNLLSKNRNFSTYLIGIAKAAVDGMWLVGIKASFSEQGIALIGYASQASSIQKFISQLASQEEFSGVNFQLQEMNNVENDKDKLLNFIISTKGNATK